MTDFSEIYNKAVTAATVAACLANAEMPPESSRGLDCGFAWVVIRPGTCAFARWLRKNKIGNKHHAGGWQIWNPSGHHTQSVGPLLKGAQAFQEVCARYNIAGVETGSRYD